jgi:hypothetical protein
MAAVGTDPAPLEAPPTGEPPRVRLIFSALPLDLQPVLCRLAGALVVDMPGH